MPSFKSMGGTVAATYGITMILLVLAWMVMGLVAFIWSLVCATKTPSVGKVIFGVLLSMLTGPLWFVYWYVDKDYCRGAHHAL